MKKKSKASKVRPRAARNTAISQTITPPMADVIAARALLGQVRPALMRFPGVFGVGVGLQRTNGRHTGRVAFVVVVERKEDPKRPGRLQPTQLLPKEIFGIPVDVQASPRPRLMLSVAGGGDARAAGRTEAGHLGFMAQNSANQAVALTAMHVLVAGPTSSAVGVEVQARMFTGGFQNIGHVSAGSFGSDMDIAQVALDPGIGSSNVLLGTSTVLGAPRDANAVRLGIEVNLSVPGEDLVQGLLVDYPAHGNFLTETGVIFCDGLFRFRMKAPAIVPGWSGSIVFDPAASEPLALLSFGTDGADADGFCLAYGFPSAAHYQAWGLRPL